MRKFFRPWRITLASLHTKLVISFLVVALVPLALLVVINEQSTESILIRNANQSLLAAARQTVLTLDAFIEANLDAIRVDAQLPEFVRYLQRSTSTQSNSAEATDVINVLGVLARRDTLHLMSYSLLNAQGMTVIDTNPTDVGVDRAQHDYFQQPIQTKLSYVSAVYLTPGDDTTASLYFSHRVQDSQGNLLGVLVARYNATAIQQLVNQSNGLAGSRSFAVVIDDRDIRIAHGTIPNQRYTSIAPLAPEQAQALQGAARLPQKPLESIVLADPELDQALEQVTCQGTKCPPLYLTTHSVIEQSGRTQSGRTQSGQSQRPPQPESAKKRWAIAKMTTRPWFVAFAQPQDIFLSDIRTQIKAALLLAMVITASVTGVAILFAQQLTRSLKQLTRSVAEFTAGNLAARAAIGSKDEIGRLSVSFNTMAAQVGQLLQGLEERTEELTASQYVLFAVNELSKAIRDTDWLLQEAVTLLRDRYGVSYVQIYLWDESSQCLMQWAAAGQLEPVAKHSAKIPLQSKDSLVALAAQFQQVYTNHDVESGDVESGDVEPGDVESIDFCPLARSEVAVPLLVHGQRLGVLSIQDQTVDRFSQNDLKTFQSLAGQIAVALENSQLFYETQRAELLYREKAQQLEQTLQNLRQTQAQLIQSEKMSSLGQVVAGVAHEINNPVNFIHANLAYLEKYQAEIFTLLNLYQKYYPEPVAEIYYQMKEADLEFLTEDFSSILTSMRVGTERIRKIVQSLRNFSRLDEAEMKPVNIHEGIESTLVILQNQLKQQQSRSAIEVIKHYQNLPLIECYAGQLNQVFMNLITNAIDALEKGVGDRVPPDEAPRIWIETASNHRVNPASQQPSIMIRIRDNGVGMTETVQKKLFDPFFTTKDVGQGMGLGLSVSYQIIVEKHRGRLTCRSQVGMGTEFIIEIPVYLAVVLPDESESLGKG